LLPRLYVIQCFDKKREAKKLPFFQIVAGDEARTRDLNLGKVALYQLSYSRRTCNYIRFFMCLPSPKNTIDLKPQQLSV